MPVNMEATQMQSICMCGGGGGGGVNRSKITRAQTTIMPHDHIAGFHLFWICNAMNKIKVPNRWYWISYNFIDYRIHKYILYIKKKVDCFL